MPRLPGSCLQPSSLIFNPLSNRHKISIMKNVFSINRLILLVFITLFAIGHAQQANGREPRPVVLKYLGMIRNNPVFQLDFHTGIENQRYTVRVKDEYGLTLYSENIRGGQFTRKFMLNSEELGDTVLRFEILSKETGIIAWYEVNSSDRVVRDWIVRSNKALPAKNE